MIPPNTKPLQQTLNVADDLSTLHTELKPLKTPGGHPLEQSMHIVETIPTKLTVAHTVAAYQGQMNMAPQEKNQKMSYALFTAARVWVLSTQHLPLVLLNPEQPRN